jgi:hypothetical protein
MLVRTPRDIVPGDEGVAFMPWSEVMMHMKLAGRLHRFRFSSDGYSVQLMSDDGLRDYCGAVTRGEAGIYENSGRHFYYPCPVDVDKLMFANPEWPAEWAFGFAHGMLAGIRRETPDERWMADASQYGAGYRVGHGRYAVAGKAVCV